MVSFTKAPHPGDRSQICEAWLRSAIFRINRYGLIEVRGPESLKFLQNLLTSDVRQVHPAQGQFSSWCDAKGRVNASFWLMPHADAYYLVLPRTILATVVSRLRMFVLRTKVTVRDATDELGLIGLSVFEGGSDNPTAASLPLASGAVVELDGCSVMALSGSVTGRYLAIGNRDELNRWVASSFPTLDTLNDLAWQMGDILAGIPIIEEATAGEFIPQMLNLEALGALSFTKGCYPGQEVVARLQYRGQLKRRMYRAWISTAELPVPGARLASTLSEESVGQVLTAAFTDAGTVGALVVVMTDQKEAGHIHLDSPGGPELVFEEGEVPADHGAATSS